MVVRKGSLSELRKRSSDTYTVEERLRTRFATTAILALLVRAIRFACGARELHDAPLQQLAGIIRLAVLAKPVGQPSSSACMRDGMNLIGG